MNTQEPIQWLIANWKMYGSLELLKTFMQAFKERFCSHPTVHLVFCPPAIYLQAFHEQLQSLPADMQAVLHLGAQTIANKLEGAFTGEISAPMFKELGVDYALIGHSERRNLFQEDVEQIASKVARAYDSGLIPILCVGETQKERETKQTEAVIEQQLGVLLSSVGSNPSLVAYEPVWAIGTGLVPTVPEIEAIHRLIRKVLGASANVFYGGSVNRSHASLLWQSPEVNGLLIGGASLKVDELLAIYEMAKTRKA